MPRVAGGAATLARLLVRACTVQSARARRAARCRGRIAGLVVHGTLFFSADPSLRSLLLPLSDGTTSAVLLIGALSQPRRPRQRHSRAAAIAAALFSFLPLCGSPTHAGELMHQAQRHLAEGLHPRVVCEVRSRARGALRPGHLT